MLQGCAGDGRAASLARLECIAASRGAPQAKRSTSTSGASETRLCWPYHHVSPPRGGPIIQIIPIPGSVYCVLIRIVFIVLYCCIMYCATLTTTRRRHANTRRSPHQSAPMWCSRMRGLSLKMMQMSYHSYLRTLGSSSFVSSFYYLDV